MPFYKLTKMIEYKAKQNGLQVKHISEFNTSITCHKCNNTNKKQRKTQGLFKCNKCNLEYNADLNAANNMLNRAKEQDFLARALAEARKSAATAS